MRALYTAATGMMAQELNVQVISNNIANVRTTGYKRQRIHFQDLLYEHFRRAGTQTSDQNTQVPAGTFDADLIKWTYEGDIGPADVETTQYRFIAGGAGLVAMVEFRSVSAVLVYHENTKVGRLLKSR